MPSQPQPDPSAAASRSPESERVLILDFGSQVTQLIARRLREAGVYCEIWPFDADPARIAAFGARAFILSGGPASVGDEGSPRAPSLVFESGVPVLGICYGMQTMCAQLGGAVAGSDHREFGRAMIELTDDCVLFQGVWHKGRREQVWMSHGDRVTRLPPGFRSVGISEGAPFAAVADDANADSTACCSTRRSCTRRTAPNCWRISSAASPGFPAPGRWPASATPRSAGSAIR